MHFQEHELGSKKKVLGVGLEPACLAAYAPQTYVSANFTTRANWGNETFTTPGSRRKCFARVSGCSMDRWSMRGKPPQAITRGFRRPSLHPPASARQATTAI